ncbi:non-ribosomal peptide synthetase [Micromonospora peucetia]|uniref:Amino acid adenylation domain-containing protein n=1 Tax=Micromonospora peucetia TaxID=47871 RepID=A0A1C6U9D9_9ACTN|nr:non-ribosomal peptide synthetase [Micromonospora peucetia]WSA33676.1 non-ribosomal peptide synthetase [Micromonospora peucetia]SCL50715.1 amino acid adenylation domain-containing protein [Micromonospora peucetia]
MTLQLNDPERMAEFQRRLAAAGLASPATGPTTPDRSAAPVAAEGGSPAAAGAGLPTPGAGAGRRALQPAEAGLWFLDRLHPGSPEYIVAAAVAIRGDLDPDRLAAAFAGIVARHPALRTRFADTDGTAYAEALPQADPPAVVVEAASDLDAWLTAAAAEPFDLRTAPLARLRLAADGARTVALLTAHHIVVDGAALDTLLTELFAGYAGASRTPAPVVPAERPAVTRSPESAAWWRAVLAGVEPVDPPTVGARPAGPRRGRRVGDRLGAELNDGIDALVRGHGVTRPAVFAAAYRLVLRAAYGHDDLLVGVPVSLRAEQDAGSLGNFVNLVCLRNPTRATTTVADLLRAEQRALIEAIAHRDTPFDEVSDHLAAGARGDDRMPVRAVFSHHRSREMQETRVAGLVVERLDVDLGTAKFDLTLQVEDAGAGSRLWLEHDVAMYPADIARSLLDSYLRALAAMVARPEAALSAVRLDGRRPAVAPGWTGRGDRGVVGWFEATAARHPDRIAVADGTTYGDLDAWADRIADRLRPAGPDGPPVAVLTGRTPGMLAAILAVAKTGRTYVPLDAEHPRDRIRQILDQAGVDTVLTDAGIAEPPAGRRIVDVDDCRRAPRPDGVTRRAPIPWSAPLYRIHTSGSTGAPKGVDVTHANLGSLIDGARDLLDLRPDDRWSVFHSVAFDFSVWEIWAPLVVGATVVLVDRDTARTPQRFRQLLHDERVTVLNQTPTAFGSLSQTVTADDLEPPDSLRLVVFGGEALRPSTLAGWFERLGDRAPRMVNMYGITETTVHVTWRDITREDVGVASPIGRPLPTLATVVVDADLNRQPVGFAGELMVAGAGVSLGYAGSPARTALRFVPDLTGGGGRMYRTGDRVRERADGDLDYLGRVDAQLKVRGFRIEPGEVEHVLLAHPDVTDAAVIAAQVGPAGLGLVGFVQAPPAADPDQVREFVAARLPGHMVPRVHRLDRLPRTVNGKLDRRALRDLAADLAPQRSGPADGGHPADDREQALVAVWQDLLGVADVRVTDNFFALGGDSILAVQAAAAMSGRGLPVTVADIFDHQSIRNLIAAVPGTTTAEPTEDGTAPAAPAGQADHRHLLAPGDSDRLPAGVEDAYPLTLLQQGMLFHQLEQNSYLNVTTTLVRCAAFDGELLRQAFDRVVQRHPVLRSGFDLATCSEPLQLVWRHVGVDLPVIDWRGRDDAEVQQGLRAWMAEQRERPFDLTRPPLIRFTAHRVSDTEFWFSAVECHAIMDGWSFTSTLTEVLEEYDQVCAAARDNRPLARLVPPPDSFGDHVWRERRTLADPAAVELFRDVIARARPVRIPNRTEGGASGHRQRALLPLDPEVKRGLEAATTRLRLPMKSLLLAAHAVVMSVLSNADVITLGMVTNGRPETAGGTQTRGLYLNTLPVTVTVGGRNFADLARACLAEESRLLRFRTYPGVATELAFGRQPLMTTAFNYTRFHAMKRVSSGGDVRRVGHLEEEAPTNYPLYVSFDHGAADDSDHLVLILMASPQHFTDAAVASLVACYRTVLTAMAADPSLPVTDVAWSTGNTATVAPAPDPGTLPGLHETVLARAARWPDQVAVRDAGDAVLTYRQLADAVGRAAGGLRAAGVGRGDTVGVCLPRDHRLVVTILAVLCVGAVYVPVDPDLPVARQRVIRDRAALRYVVAATPTRSRLDPELPVLDVDDLAAHPTPAGPPVATHPGELAYLMFTSGSTGEPKGVMVPHGALAAFDVAIGDRYAQGAVMLAATNASFDISVAELLIPLAHGVGVVVFDRGGRFDPDDFATVVRRVGVTMVQATPSLWTELLAGDADLSGIEAWTGGEALTARLGRSLLDRAGVVHNWYGPTETTIWSTVHPVTPADLDPAVVPVGRALPGEAAHVLGAGLRQVPDEMVGEVFIGGAGLARGYLGDPARTALRFVPDPFGAPGSRMYRTGDRAHRRADGVLHFAGRVDDQVKLNGYRIEPGEIEAVLAGLAEVARVAVAVRHGQLVAFVVPEQDEVDLAALRGRLRDLLPAHLVPRLVRADDLPVNANGKVDRGRLPDVVFTQDVSTAEFVPASSAAEQTLADVWREVLGAEQVGVHDNFLDLGGDSITALRTVARVKARGLQVAVADMLGPQTLAEVAAGTTTVAGSAGSTAGPDGPASTDGPRPGGGRAGSAGADVPSGSEPSGRSARAGGGVRPNAGGIVEPERAADPAASLDGVDISLAGLDEETARALVARLSSNGEELSR